MEIYIKINFFLSGEESRETFKQETRTLEDTLEALGRITIDGSGGGIAQFTLRTSHSIAEVRAAVAALELTGETTVNEISLEEEHYGNETKVA